MSDRVKLAEVAAAADAATPGGWGWQEGGGGHGYVVVHGSMRSFVEAAHVTDARHIATSDPSTVKAMVEALEVVHRVMVEHDNYCDPGPAVAEALALIDALIDFTEPEGDR